jgi:hypothetical protein
MSMDESSARRVILVQAIETADAQGKLLSEVERHQIDRDARHAAQAVASGASAAERFLELRARKVLEAVGQRSPRIAALQSSPRWRQWLLVAAPLATLVLGAITERIADPHRVDLLSLPLLAIVAWNLVVYLVLLAGLLPRRARERPLLQAMSRWAAGLREWRRRSGHLGADVTALFYVRWHQATSALLLRRATAGLHMAALGWAAGVAASLLVKGLVVQYRIGWESTFLDARQVHAILKVLLMPVVALFPFEPFSIQEVAALQLGPGDIARADPRWVWMYAALLLVVVIVPRAVLAAIASWRAASLARRIRPDLGEPYFQRLISLLTPAQVQLGVLARRDSDRAILLRVLAQGAPADRLLMSSAHGDTLRYVQLSPAEAPLAPGEPSGAQQPGWLHRVRRALRQTQTLLGRGPAEARAAPAADETDVVLLVAGEAGDLETAKPFLRWLGKPVLVLANRPDAPETEQPGLVARCQAEARELPLVAEVLSFDAFARCWVQDPGLLDAIGRCLPQAKAPGFARVVAAWDERNQQRLRRSMAAAAEHLVYAARQSQEVPGSAVSAKSLVSAGERQAQAQARQATIDDVVARLDRSAAEMLARQRALHGIGEAAAGSLPHRLERKFVVQQGVDTPQAGIAGAATGAAMGASVDLLVGGLTLGAAAAIGALVGGSTAFIAAAWKNRGTAGGSTIVQLSDEMMEAMTEAALLHYLAAIHYGRRAAGAASELPSVWTADVAAAVARHKAALDRIWGIARAHPEQAVSEALAGELESITREVLQALYHS